MMEITRPLRKTFSIDHIPPISISRLEKNIVELGKIGRNEMDGGVYRMGFTQEDMVARKWLMQKIEQAGLEASMDGAANVFGLDNRAQTKTSFLIGSHLDSVPCAGLIDGTLGVLAGLECMQVIKENNIALKENLELVATSDEEGRFGGMIGAEAICGEITLDRVRKSKDINGVSLEKAMKTVGLNPFDILKASRRKEFMSGFLEIHIEQGPVLDKGGQDVGIVDSISGVFHWQVTLIGECNHSGTTPMDMRKDAFQALTEFSQQIPRILEENGSENARATIGKVELVPPNPHTIPGKVVFSLVGRDFTDQSMKELELAFRKALAAISRRREIKFEFEELSRIEPTLCDKNMMNTIEAEAKALDINYLVLPSGAGHDAQFFAKYMPAGMIFVPSLNGISHSPNEWSSLEHIEIATNLMLRCILKLLAK